MNKAEMLKILDKVDDDTEIKIVGAGNDYGAIITIKICYDTEKDFDPIVLIDYEC